MIVDSPALRHTGLHCTSSSQIRALKPFRYFVPGHFANEPAAAFVKADQSASAPIRFCFDDEVIGFSQHKRNDTSLGRKRKIMRKANSSPRQILSEYIDRLLRKRNPVCVDRHELHLAANRIAISQPPLAWI